MKYIIIAHTEAQALKFAWDNKLQRSEFRYVFEREQIEGIRNVTIIFLDGWEYHRNAAYLWDFIHIVQGPRKLKILELKDTDILQREP